MTDLHTYHSAEHLHRPASLPPRGQGMGVAARRPPLPNPPPQGGREALCLSSLYLAASVMGDRSTSGGLARLGLTAPSATGAMR